MKNIRKTSSGVYQFRKQIEGQEFQFSSKSKTKVIEFKKSFEKNIKKIASDNLQQQNIKFNDFARTYFTLYRQKKVKERTQEEWEGTFKYFDKYFNKQFNKIKAEEFQNFLNILEDKKPTTALKIYNKVCAICKKAFALNIIKLDIAEILEAPNVTYGIRRALTFDEQVKFIDEINKKPDDEKIYFLFCLITSARREEAVKYKPKDLNRINRTLFVNGTKTLNAPRTIRVTDKFISLLDKIPNGFKHTSDYYSRVAKGIFEKIGANDLTLNCLRHTCATNMVYLGIPVDFRKHVMGHSTTVTTDRIYTHIEVGITKKQIQKLYGNLYFTDYT